MAGELTIVGGDNKLALPAHIAARFKPEDSNILAGDRIPSLSVKGKVFTITAEGETTQLMTTDGEGNEYPVQALPVVVLDYAAKMGRAYYEGAYDPSETKAPTCWSLDGVVPEEEVEEKQSPKCATCPMSVKGSAVSEQGKSVSACGQHRILAVVPAKRLDLPPLRLRISQTANFDGRSPDLRQKGLFAFQNYLDMLKARGVPHTQSVVTRLSFDPGAAYPKLLFQAHRWTDDAELAKIDAIMASGKVGEILGRTGTMTLKANSALTAPKASAALPAPKAVVLPPDEDEPAAKPVPTVSPQVARLQAEAAEAKTAAEADPGDEEAQALAQLLASRARKAMLAEAAAAAPAKSAATPAVEAKTAPKPRGRPPKAATETAPTAPAMADLGDEGDGSFAAPEAKPAAKPKAKPVEAVKAVQIPADVEQLLTTWDD